MSVVLGAHDDLSFLSCVILVTCPKRVMHVTQRRWLLWSSCGISCPGISCPGKKDHKLFSDGCYAMTVWSAGKQRAFNLSVNLFCWLQQMDGCSSHAETHYMWCASTFYVFLMSSLTHSGCACLLLLLLMVGCRPMCVRHNSVDTPCFSHTFGHRLMQ